MKIALSFRILSTTGALIREEKLSQGVIKIGKVASAHLKLDDDSVSRMHAIIEITGETASLIDLGSTGGTFVNGQKINKVKLASGDAIQVGNTRIEVTIAPVTETVAAAAPAAPMLAVVSPAPAATPMPVAFAQTAPVAPPAVPARPPRGTPSVTATASAIPAPFAAKPAAPAAFAAMTAAETDEVGTRAVEVAAMFGDTVVDVKHCTDPRGGKVTPLTWGFVAGGVACLLASATAFYLAVDNAARNKAALAYHRDVLHAPEYSFRPRTLSGAVDGVAWGGLAFALGGLSTALLRMRSERKSPFYRIGTAPGVEQPLDEAPAPAFPLVAPSGDDFVFNFGAGMEGEVVAGGVTTQLAELVAAGRARPSAKVAGAFELPIAANTRIRARAGKTTFVVTPVAAPRKQATPLFTVESRTLAYVGASLAVHLGVWAFLQTIPPDEAGIAVNTTNEENISGRTNLTAKDDATKDPEQKPEGADSGSTEEASGTPMALPAGDMGDPKRTEIARATMQHRDENPHFSREEAIAAARDAGIVGAMRERTGGVPAFGATTDLSSAFDDADRWGGLDGEPGQGGGNFGAWRGPGQGGGCPFADVSQCGTIGASYGKIGPGKYGDKGWSLRGTHDGLRMDRDASLPPTPKKPIEIGGGLDKSIIKRYINRNRAKFIYCYEKELLANKDLEGDVATTFFITGNGAVSDATAKGFDNNVDSCVATVLKQISFPPPNDGGIVTVNYPFHFTHTGK